MMSVTVRAGRSVFFYPQIRSAQLMMVSATVVWPVLSRLHIYLIEVVDDVSDCQNGLVCVLPSTYLRNRCK